MTSDSIPNHAVEQWRDIPGYETIYQVSNHARIKRLAGSEKCNRDRLIKSYLATNGYYFVRLCVKSVKSNRSLHSLVALAFLEKPSDKNEINHKDGDKSNNHPDNLEYMTRSENNTHAYRVLGRAPVRSGGARGEANHTAKLTSIQVIEIRKRYAEGEKNGVLASEFKVSPSRITRIVQRKQWKHLEG